MFEDGHFHVAIWTICKLPTKKVGIKNQKSKIKNCAPFVSPGLFQDMDLLQKTKSGNKKLRDEST